MERKRKLPARAARVESVSKKRTSTTPEQRTQTPTVLPSLVVEESLPKSIIPGKALPTLDEPQPENLSSKEFQTVAESGVLTDSLQRSRQRWISEGIFERYWTKTTKKKGIVEPPNNPGKDTMTKLGTCTITVEPHIIDATMYAIKEPPRPAAPSVSQQPMHRPILQYGPPNGVMPPPPPPIPIPPLQQKPPPPPPQPIPQPSPKPKDIPLKIPTSPAPSHYVQSSAAHTQMNGVSPGSRPPQMMQRNSQQQNLPPPNIAAVTPPAPAGKTTDPVIQMLAERAATDSDLKALMRIVANGEATPEELKRFQSHIDDLTRIQKARQAAAQLSQPPKHTNHPPPHPPPATPQVNGHTRPAQSPVPSPAPPPEAKTPPVSVAVPQPQPQPQPQSQPQSQPQPQAQAQSQPQAQPQPQPQPQALRSKGPLPPSKPDISGVVFEFTGGSGDRFLFPKFSILEYLPHGQVIASFLIVRKGSSSDSPTYDPELDYYQPITIRLHAHQGRQLEALQKVIAPHDEVRRYMDDIMDNMTRAEYVLLAMRLPKDTEQSSTANKEAAKVDQLDNQVLWTTTNPTPVAKIPVATKKVLSEEEKYQTFINSVSAQ